jgi:hypothetical protein
LNPIDLVLANIWLSTPLLPEILEQPSLLLLLASAGCIMLLLGILGVVKLMRKHPGYLAALDTEKVLFLLAGIFLPLGPVLVLSTHPSETYLYASAAFYSVLIVLIGSTLYRFANPGVRTALIVCVGLLLGLYAAATWERNGRVYDCGTVANRIVKESTAGSAASLMVADVSAAPQSYGYYRFAGLSTIGDRGQAERAMTHALQLATNNTQIRVRVVDTTTLQRECTVIDLNTNCLLIYPDGKVIEYPHVVAQ